MIAIQTHDSAAVTPSDTAFWQWVAALQAADDEAEEANDEAETADVQTLKNELAVWQCKGGGDGQEVVRLARPGRAGPRQMGPGDGFAGAQLPNRLLDPY